MKNHHLMENYSYVAIHCDRCPITQIHALFDYDNIHDGRVIPCPSCGSLDTKHKRATFTLGKFRVACRTDSKHDGSEGKYVLATSRDFDSLEEATEYADTVSPSRGAEVLMIVDKFLP